MTEESTPHYLVIGGCGFLGKRIVEMLLDRGLGRVSVLDLKAVRFDERLTHCLSGDITKVEDVERVLGMGVDILIHTASPIHGLPPSVYYRVNVEGTRLLLRSAREMGIKKFIFTGSASVIYNGQDLIDADESTPYCSVHMDAYNESKVGDDY